MEAQTEGATEKDESVRRTSWSWPGGPGRAATLRTQKKRGGQKKEKLLFKRSFGHLPPSEQWGWHQRADL